MPFLHNFGENTVNYITLHFHTLSPLFMPSEEHRMQTLSTGTTTCITFHLSLSTDVWWVAFWSITQTENNLSSLGNDLDKKLLEFFLWNCGIVHKQNKKYKTCFF